jgi:hypothetical protein
MQNSVSGNQTKLLTCDQEDSPFISQPIDDISVAGQTESSTSNACSVFSKRSLTQAQMAFAEGISIGKTHKQAYRDAYPGDTSVDASISTSASRLLRDTRIQKLLRDVQQANPETLIDDAAAMKRFVLTQLLRCATTFKQEGSRLKALELVGKASGLFVATPELEPTVVTADQLRRELSVHLKLVDSALL